MEKYFPELLQDDFDIDPDIKPRVKCTWGRNRIKRFIYRYVCMYRKKRSRDRDMFLSQLEEIARENGVILPTREQMEEKKTVPRDRLTAELVDANDTRVGTYKYYHDGSNIVAYIPNENKYSGIRELHAKTKWDELFDVHYKEIVKKYKGVSKYDEAKNDRIEIELVNFFYEAYDYNDKIENETCPEFIHRKIYNCSAAHSERLKRFHRKKNQTQWTAWWTITYSDEKFSSEQQFRNTLLNKFRNLAVRKGWRIMGVFEHGEEYGRLHFHGFFYIPPGQEIGELVHRSNYNKKKNCRHDYIANTEFEECFGINEYEDIEEAMRSDVKAMANYTAKMLRYMEKGEKVFYSRHIPTEFIGEFRTNDMLLFFQITCKRPVKRYIVDPIKIARSATKIERIRSIETEELIDIGLIDEEVPIAA